MPPNNAVGLHRRRAVAAARQSSPNIGARARGGDGVDGAGEARGTRGGRGSYNAWLHRPVHSAPVAVFRVLLGLCAAAHSMGAARREVQRWRETSLVVPPALVGWLPEELRLAPPAEELTGVLLLGALWLVALTLTTGTLLPISAPAFALLLAYICSVDAALVFSHGGYVLWVLVLAYALLGSGGAWLAVDSVLFAGRRTVPQLKARQRIPAWHAGFLRLLTLLPYAFGAAAKLGADWRVHNEPVLLALPSLIASAEATFAGWPLAQCLRMAEPQIAARYLCGFVLAVELLVPLLLLAPRLRLTVGVPLALTLQLLNTCLFPELGLLPYVLAASLVLWAEPEACMRTARHLSLELLAGFVGKSRDEVEESYALGKSGLPSRDDAAAEAEAELEVDAAEVAQRCDGATAWQRWLKVLVALAGLAANAALPLRHVAALSSGGGTWPPDAAWDWRGDTVARAGWTALELRDVRSGEVWTVLPASDATLAMVQRKALMAAPGRGIVAYAARLAELLEHRGARVEDVRITVAASCVAVNGYGAQPLYAPGAQLWPPETDIDGNSQGGNTLLLPRVGAHASADTCEPLPTAAGLDLDASESALLWLYGFDEWQDWAYVRIFAPWEGTVRLRGGWREGARLAREGREEVERQRVKSGRARPAPKARQRTSRAAPKTG